MTRQVLRDLVNWTVERYRLAAGAVSAVELDQNGQGWRARVALGKARRDRQGRELRFPYRELDLYAAHDAHGGHIIQQIHSQLQ